jgi:hypothetical protein
MTRQCRDFVVELVFGTCLVAVASRSTVVGMSLLSTYQDRGREAIISRDAIVFLAISVTPPRSPSMDDSHGFQTATGRTRKTRLVMATSFRAKLVAIPADLREASLQIEKGCDGPIITKSTSWKGPKSTAFWSTGAAAAAAPGKV